jgi:hypothetical protein
MPGSAWLNFLILVCTAGVGLFSLMKDWENHQHPVRRYAVLVLILGGLIGGGINLYFSSKQAAKIEKDRASEQSAAKTRIELLQNLMTSEQTSRHNDTMLFLDRLGKLNDQLSLLKTDQKTQQLKQEIVSLQETLKTSDKASTEVVRLHSAALTFGFGSPPPDGTLSDTTTVTKVNGVVTVDIAAWNSSEVSATNGFIYLRLCITCKYAEEPEYFHQVKGTPETDRERQFQLIGSKINLETIRTKVIPPDLPGVKAFLIGVRYVCQTCVESDWRNLTVNIRE